MSILSSTHAGKFGIKITPDVLRSYGFVPHEQNYMSRYIPLYWCVYWCYKNKIDCIVNYISNDCTFHTTFQTDICYISNVAELETVIDFFNAKTKEEKRKMWNKLKKMR